VLYLKKSLISEIVATLFFLLVYPK